MRSFSAIRRKPHASVIRQAPAGESFPLDVSNGNRDLVRAVLRPPLSAAQTPIQELKGSGQPLPEPEQEFFERRLRHDFGQVRIHTDEAAAGLALMLHARAVTAGRDLFFSRNQFQPQTEAGRALLAHELVHVIQQGASSDAAIGRKGKRRSRKRPVSGVSGGAAAFRRPGDIVVNSDGPRQEQVRGIVRAGVRPRTRAPSAFIQRQTEPGSVGREDDELAPPKTESPSIDYGQPFGKDPVIAGYASRIAVEYAKRLGKEAVSTHRERESAWRRHYEKEATEQAGPSRRARKAAGSRIKKQVAEKMETWSTEHPKPTEETAEAYLTDYHKSLKGEFERWTATTIHRLIWQPLVAGARGVPPASLLEVLLLGQSSRAVLETEKLIICDRPRGRSANQYRICWGTFRGRPGCAPPKKTAVKVTG